MMPLMKTCKEATALLVAREDRTLSLGDKVALRFHLLICKACPRFARQMLTLRNGMKEWRNYTTPD
jgi:Putative zinc-finger